VRYPDLLATFLTPGGFCHPANKESLAAVHTKPGLELEGHLTRHDRHASGVHHDICKPWNHLP
jgi:hypothetical protein